MNFCFSLVWHIFIMQIAIEDLYINDNDVEPISITNDAEVTLLWTMNE